MRKLLVLLVITLVFLQSWGALGARARKHRYKAYKLHAPLSLIKPSGLRPEKLLEIPLVRQSTDWTCGVGSAMAALYYFGVEYREDILTKALKSNANIGTEYRNIVGLANAELKKVNPNASVIARKNMSFADLEAEINKGNPVQVALQAWADDPATTPYKNDTDDGHYSVVIGYDKNNFYFMDPSTIGDYTYIPKSEFADRWHDVGGTDNEPVIQFGIIYSLGNLKDGKSKTKFNPNNILELKLPQAYPYITYLESGKSPKIKLIELPKTRQSSNWTSGLASLQSILYYFGSEYRQDALAESLKIPTDIYTQGPFVDMDYEAVVKFAKDELKTNFPAAAVELNRNMSLSDLRQAMKEKKPVLVALRAWTDANSNLDDGRYAVVIGLDKNKVILMSPSILGNYAYIKMRDFKNRWQNIGIIFSNGTKDNSPSFKAGTFPKMD